MQILQNLAFTKSGNVQNIGCFGCQDKNFSVRVDSEYEEVCKILNSSKIASMVFLVDETCTEMTFLSLEDTLCPLKSIITA